MSFLVQVLLISFAAMLIVGIPISAALVLAAAARRCWPSSRAARPGPDTAATLRDDNFPLLAIPFFILAGSIARSRRHVRPADRTGEPWSGVAGGVAMVCVVACMLFAAVSGSTAATTAAIRDRPSSRR